ncbi:MAG: hypothetical protein LAT76_11800 [Schleiferiaceae bacterium]|nr:hypothetical protein [Schleiferiaceae bacterium]
MNKFLILAVSVFFFSSCDKENQVSDEEVNMLANSPSVLSAMPIIKHFSCTPSYDNYPCGPGSGCYSPGFQCLNEIDVNLEVGGESNPPSDEVLALVDELYGLIELGDVTSFFSTPEKYNILFPELDQNNTQLLEALANGTQPLYFSQSAEKVFFLLYE